MTGTLIDLIRHGEPAGGRRYRGHGLDDPLTEKGWSQMWMPLANFLHGSKSLLLRCSVARHLPMLWVNGTQFL